MSEAKVAKIFGFSLDEASKLVGGSVVVIYLLGYLVLSFYFSSYGFGQSSPLRPRVLEAGTCFLAFTILPFALGLAVDNIPIRNVPYGRLMALKFGILPILCGYFINLPGFTGGIDYSDPLAVFLATTVPGQFLTFILWIFGGLAIVFAFVVWLWRCYHKHTMAAIIALWSVSTFLFWLRFKNRHTGSSHLFFWCCGLAALALGGDVFRRIGILNTSAGRDPVKDEGDAPDTNQHAQLSNLKISAKFYSPIAYTGSVALIVWLFVIWVYGVIPFRLGGGKPVNVGVAVKHSGDSVRIIHGGLLDENDHGYYLLLTGTTHAILIARDNIKFVYFTDTDTKILSDLE